MKRESVAFLSAFAVLFELVTGGVFAPVYDAFSPQQVHLSYAERSTVLTVTWVTEKETPSSAVQFGQVNFTQTVVGAASKFVDGGTLKRTIYVHRATLNDLKPNVRYVYRCGCPGNWSKTFSFRVQDQGTDWTPRFALLGDMGTTNHRSLKWLIGDVAKQMYDAVIHVGDFAYNLDDDDGTRGDLFMRQIEPIAAFVPYMTLPGNHEYRYNFSHYKNRFTMPGGDGQGQFFSFDVGPAHFVFFSTEFYYFLEYGFEQLVNQYKWLEKDLKEATKPENRSQRPWIFAMGHRPFYCSSSDDEMHCVNKENMVRVGIPHIHSWSLEELLYKYNVDLVVTAHEHNYERMFPVYNFTVCKGSESEPYTNPRAPVHIVSGSAGCDEHLDPFRKHPNDYSAFHASDYGYSRMTYNRTHLHWEQISDLNGTAIDRMTLIKTKQQRFNCHS